MNTVLLNSDERIDDLLIGGLKVIQSEHQFRFSLDAVLLAHFAFIKQQDNVVDLGTGTGVLGLLAIARGAGCVNGIELNPQLADMAARSVDLNGLTSKINVINADLREVKNFLPAETADMVISNPPYRSAETGRLSKSDWMAIARHEITATLSDIVQAAKYLVKYRGRFALIHLPERLTEILAVMSGSMLEPKRLQLVYPAIDKKPVMVLVEGIKGGKPGLEVLPPLIIYNEDGSYTDAIKSYYKYQ